VVYTLDSDDEYSEISDFESDYYPSDGDESDSAVTDKPASQHSMKRNRPSAALFQWDSGVFSPVVQDCDNSASGISDWVIPDQPTALDIFQFFFFTKIMQDITAETNKYYVFVTQRMPASPCPRV
jgi:hypothetical protein